MPKNWDRAAMRFASAKYNAPQGMFDITFENNDHFLVAAESVLTWLSPASLGRAGVIRAGNTAMATAIAWDRMRIGETGDVLEIPVDDAVIEIPWDRFRAIADPDFRAHLARQAQERARRIGERIRAMRLEAGLAPAALAEKVGLPQDVIAKLEAGEIEPESDLLQHIAGVLGRRLRNFSEE